MFISESIQICLKSCVSLYYLSCFKKHDFMTYKPCFRMWFMKIAKFERVWCSAISEQKVKIYIIQHTNMHINCRCRISSSLQNVVTEDRPSSQHVSPRGWCGGAGKYNSVRPWLCLPVDVDGYKWRSVSCPRHHEDHESCPVTDEADINPGNHQGLSLFHVRSFSMS